MAERTGMITMRNNPLTLLGRELKPGEAVPDFTVLNNDLESVRFSSFQGKVCVISSVPSLDTPVCDMQTRKFNDMAANLDSDVRILTISMDLPFAQKRWCGAAGVDRVITFSDHFNGAFGDAFGVMIKELRLLARAIFIIDREGILRYTQLVREVAKEPDYDAVMEALKDVV